MRKWLALAGVLCVVACGTQMQGEPSLIVTLNPNRVSDSTPVMVKVSAVTADGKVGTGKVKVTSTAGSLVDPVELTLDAYGTANTTLVCDPTTEPECSSAVRVVGEWTSNRVDTTAEARLNSGGTGGTGGNGGSGGAGGGGGSGGGTGETLSSVSTVCDASVPANRFGAPLRCCQPREVTTTGPECSALVLGHNGQSILRFVDSTGARSIDVPVTAHIPSVSVMCGGGDDRFARLTLGLPPGAREFQHLSSVGRVTSDGTWVESSTAYGRILLLYSLTRADCDALRGGQAIAAYVLAASMSFTAEDATVYTMSRAPDAVRSVVLFVWP